MSATSSPGRAGKLRIAEAGIAVLALAVLALWTAILLSCCRFQQRVPTVGLLPPAPPGITAPAQVEVLLSSAPVAEFSVGCPDGGEVYATSAAGSRLIAAGQGPWWFKWQNGRLDFNGQMLAETAARVTPREGVFQFYQRTYRGSLRVTAEPQGGLTALNVIEPEQYLRNVVGSETYASWPLDALMAQAVAARTYMLYAVAARGRLGPADMAYRGTAWESDSADLAVQLTRGVVMTHGGKLFSAYFHSTCGGHTADASKVFGVAAIEPLSGVPCRWCRSSPRYRWEARLAAAQIAALLGRPDVKAVTGIAPDGAGADGYARSVIVNGGVRMAANEFRLAVGANELRSTRFTVTRQGDGFLFEGTGFGHGVGLCQWGAYGMARDDYGWKEILNHYYPGAAVQKAY